MKLVSFTADSQARLGVVRGDEVVDLARAVTGAPTDLAAWLRAGKAGVDAARRALDAKDPSAVHKLGQLKLRPPIENPGKIICLGLNYADHAAEGGHSKPAYPSFFMRCTTSLVAHGEPMIRPRISTQFDYEAELVAVIGKRGRHIGIEQALDHVAGYSVFNDGSIRDYQRKTPQWTIGKNFDGTGAFGPAFVTADELAPGATGLRICSRLNGEIMQDANTDLMLFPVAETVALLSECLTLEVGDVLVMGTPAGVGAARKPPVWMKDGDTIEIEIEKVGLLSNRIRDEAA